MAGLEHSDESGMGTERMKRGTWSLANERLQNGYYSTIKKGKALMDPIALNSLVDVDLMSMENFELFLAERSHRLRITNRFSNENSDTYIYAVFAWATQVKLTLAFTKTKD